jgi:hypothetical protein
LEGEWNPKFLAVSKYNWLSLKTPKNKQLSIPESYQRPGGLVNEARTSCPPYSFCSRSHCIAKKDDTCLFCSRLISNEWFTLWLLMLGPQNILLYCQQDET